MNLFRLFEVIIHLGYLNNSSKALRSIVDNGRLSVGDGNYIFSDKSSATYKILLRDSDSKESPSDDPEEVVIHKERALEGDDNDQDSDGNQDEQDNVGNIFAHPTPSPSLHPPFKTRFTPVVFTYSVNSNEGEPDDEFLDQLLHNTSNFLFEEFADSTLFANVEDSNEVTSPTVQPTIEASSAPTIKASSAPSTVTGDVPGDEVSPDVLPTSTVQPTIAASSAPSSEPTIAASSAPTIKASSAPSTATGVVRRLEALYILEGLDLIIRNIEYGDDSMAVMYAGELIYSLAPDSTVEEELSTAQVSEVISNLSDEELLDYLNNYVKTIDSPYTQNIESVVSSIALPPTQKPSVGKSTSSEEEDDGDGGLAWWAILLIVVSALICCGGCIVLAYALLQLKKDDDEEKNDLIEDEDGHDQLNEIDHDWPSPAGVEQNRDDVSSPSSGYQENNSTLDDYSAEMQQPGTHGQPVDLLSS